MRKRRSSTIALLTAVLTIAAMIVAPNTQATEAATFSLTYTSGRAGTSTWAIPDAPCPPDPTGYQHVAFSFVDSAGTEFEFGGPIVDAEGTWSEWMVGIPERRPIPFQPGRFQEDAAVGQGEVRAKCVVNMEVTQEYQPQPYYVTDGSARFGLSTGRVMQGETIQVNALDHCPAGTTEAWASIGNWAGASTQQSIDLESGGAWTSVGITIPIEFESGAYIVVVNCFAMEAPRWHATSYAQQVIRVGYTYVALGDSYSSGQGVPPYDEGTDTDGPPENHCRRSGGAYPRLLDASTQLDLVAFVACGGSETTDILSGRFDEPPQIQAIAEHDPEVITITVGGNNIGFVPLAIECITNGAGDCTNSAEYAYTRDRINNYLSTELGALYDNIDSHLGPYARVLIVGYPQMIPDPSINTLPNCWYLSRNEKATARDVINDLNAVIRDEVAQAGARFEYVDPNAAGSPFEGHELCLEASYYNGLDVVNQGESLHPNSAGQTAYGQLIAQYL